MLHTPSTQETIKTSIPSRYALDINTPFRWSLNASFSIQDIHVSLAIFLYSEPTATLLRDRS